MCCTGFLKTMMFIFNGVIFLAGGAILGVGIWVSVDKNSLLGVLDQIKDAPSELSQLANVGYLLIAVGAVLAIMGFLGCCGAVTESKCMLLTFFIIVLIIFIAEVAGAIVVFAFQPLAKELLQKVNDDFVKTIKENYGSDAGFTELMNDTMKELKCCGFNNYTDFDGSPFNVIGCYNALVKLLEDNAAIVGGVAIGIAALEIAAMVVSMVLYKNVGK